MGNRQRSSRRKKAKMSKDKSALVILAEGAEEMETVIIVDILRRAKIHVTLASLCATSVACSRQVVIGADCLLKNLDSDQMFDAVVLPGGGKGAENLAAS